MVLRLGKFYSKRIVNVNVNIMLAGLVAIPPTSLAVHLAYHTFGIQNPWYINLITFFADMLFDVATYYVLHWLANHWPHRVRTRRLAATASATNDAPLTPPGSVTAPPPPIIEVVVPPKPHLSYFKDATLVQMERIVLSPVLYVIVFASQHVLIHKIEPEYATAIGLLAGILTTRVIHTFWMLYQQRRWPRHAPKSA